MERTKDSEDAASLLFLRSFDRAVMVAQWYELPRRLETRETRTRVRTLPLPSSGYGVNTRWMSPLPYANLHYIESLNWRKWTNLKEHSRWLPPFKSS